MPEWMTAADWAATLRRRVEEARLIANSATIYLRIEHALEIAAVLSAIDMKERARHLQFVKPLPNVGAVEEMDNWIDTVAQRLRDVPPSERRAWLQNEIATFIEDMQPVEH